MCINASMVPKGPSADVHIQTKTQTHTTGVADAHVSRTKAAAEMLCAGHACGCRITACAWGGVRAFSAWYEWQRRPAHAPLDQ